MIKRYVSKLDLKSMIKVFLEVDINTKHAIGVLCLLFCFWVLGAQAEKVFRHVRRVLWVRRVIALST